MKKQGLDYLRLRLATVRDMGANEAILSSLIAVIAKNRKHDKDGFVRIETAYLAAQMGLNERTVVRLRAKLIQAGKIAFKPGANQNKQGRYKIMM